MAIEWTEKHEQEAARRLYEIAARLAGAGQELRAMEVSAAVALHIDEEQLREILCDPPGADMGIEQIDREVRRVDGLATGRLVREVMPHAEIRLINAQGYRVPLTSPNERGQRIVRVRVTRIRRSA